jgi:hypothetical protein
MKTAKVHIPKENGIKQGEKQEISRNSGRTCYWTYWETIYITQPSSRYCASRENARENLNVFEAGEVPLHEGHNHIGN